MDTVEYKRIVKIRDEKAQEAAKKLKADHRVTDSTERETADDIHWYTEFLAMKQMYDELKDALFELNEHSTIFPPKVIAAKEKIDRWAVETPSKMGPMYGSLKDVQFHQVLMHWAKFDMKAGITSVKLFTSYWKRTTGKSYMSFLREPRLRPREFMGYLQLFQQCWQKN